VLLFNAGRKAVEDADRKAADDAVADLVREALEDDYAPELLVLSLKAPDTTRKYLNEWSKFVAYLKDDGVDPVPPRPAAVAYYLHNLVKQGANEGRIKLVRAAIGHGYHTLGEHDPTDDILVR
jgi:hypothetical protein